MNYFKGLQSTDDAYAHANTLYNTAPTNEDQNTCWRALKCAWSAKICWMQTRYNYNQGWK